MFNGVSRCVGSWQRRAASTAPSADGARVDLAALERLAHLRAGRIDEAAFRTILSCIQAVHQVDARDVEPLTSPLELYPAVEQRPDTDSADDVAVPFDQLMAMAGESRTEGFYVAVPKVLGGE